ncbi:hypothetical protein CC1G_02766 [Coprinopsis cinerea okayama7|uniref:Uncharacterized protein n=1 Tax=Coprinopsis cinerea (strain Okayama-7 / 130 / ATCC MYA-4618 / FGSC 9003) TaxID=240176 RepID=A8MZW7_COPC7|nr:hypothetical protein CC1G_02766 [Coprinopsis cinerea okayama7\|eukprot:XP_001828185.2 hypothetical protein CC1G_02766 [Coprinopsis cinerea okayama7\
MPGLISLDWEWFPYQTSNEEPLTPTTYKGLRQMIINSTTNIRYFMYSYASGIRFAEVLRQNPSIEILGVHNERDSADDDLILDLNPIFQPNENWERVAARPYSLLELPRPPPLIFYLNKQSTDHHYPDNRCHGLDIKPSLFSEGSKIQLVFIPGVYAHRRERLGMIERVASYLDEHGSFDGTKDWRGDVATVSALRDSVYACLTSALTVFSRSPYFEKFSADPWACGTGQNPNPPEMKLGVERSMKITQEWGRICSNLRCVQVDLGKEFVRPSTGEEWIMIIFETVRIRGALPDVMSGLIGCYPLCDELLGRLRPGPTVRDVPSSR